MALKISDLAAAQTLVTQLKDTRQSLAYLRGEVEPSTSAAATKFGIGMMNIELPGSSHGHQLHRIVANTGMDGEAFAANLGKLLEDALARRERALIGTLTDMGLDPDA